MELKVFISSEIRNQICGQKVFLLKVKKWKFLVKKWKFFFISGTHPTVTDGIVPAVGCVVESSDECCGAQLNMAIKNCSIYVVYHLTPPPTCSVGYCAGHRLPCPEGLTSPSGFTPCECKYLFYLYLFEEMYLNTSQLDIVQAPDMARSKWSW